MYGNTIVNGTLGTVQKANIDDALDTLIAAKSPKDYFSEIDTRNLLLICIELFEDRLFGASSKTDIITDRVLLKLKAI